MLAGDSELEMKLGVAPGFPNVKLGRNDLVTTNDVLNLIGVSEGDEVQVDVSIVLF